MTVAVVMLPALPLVVHPRSRAILRFEYAGWSSRCRYENAVEAFERLREICDEARRSRWLSSVRVEIAIENHVVLSELVGDVADDMAGGAYSVIEVEPVALEAVFPGLATPDR